METAGVSLDDIFGAPKPLAAALGGRLRRLRQMRRLTLQEVGTAVDISPSFLSMVERGQADVSLSRFTRLAGFYGIRPGELLLDEPATQEPSITQLEDALLIDRGVGITYRLLPNAPSGLQVFHVALAPHTFMRDVIAHDGDDFCFVIEGRVTLLYGDRTFVLNTAQSVTYIALLPHAFRNDHDEEAAFIAVTTKPYW